MAVAGAAHRFFDQSLGDVVQPEVLGLTDLDQSAESLLGTVSGPTANDTDAWSTTDRLPNARCSCSARCRASTSNRAL